MLRKGAEQHTLMAEIVVPPKSSDVATLDSDSSIGGVTLFGFLGSLLEVKDFISAIPEARPV